MDISFTCSLNVAKPYRMLGRLWDTHCLLEIRQRQTHKWTQMHTCVSPHTHTLVWVHCVCVYRHCNQDRCHNRTGRWRGGVYLRSLREWGKVSEEVTVKPTFERQERVNQAGGQEGRAAFRAWMGDFALGTCWTWHRGSRIPQCADHDNQQSSQKTESRPTSSFPLLFPLLTP